MSNLNNKARIAAISAMVGAAISCADAFAQTSDNTAEVIAQAQRNTAVIRAKIEERKAMKELESIQELKAPESTKGASDASEQAAKEKEREASSDEPNDPAPGLLAIYGRDNHLIASLRMANGLTQDARVGDEIDGGFKVKSVGSNRVVLERRGKEFVLRIFSGATPSNNGAQQSQTVRPNTGPVQFPGTSVAPMSNNQLPVAPRSSR